MNDKAAGSGGGRVRYLAHSANGQGDGVEEELAEHLRRVSERAADYAGAFGADAEGWLAGMLHDVGKYSPRFLDRLAGKTSGLDHWTPGAIIARKKYGKTGTAMAASVLGHHLGLEHAGPSLMDELKEANRNPADNLTESNTALLLSRLSDDGLHLPASLDSSVYDSRQPTVAAMLDIRMLFSALVDADFIETEAHFNGDAQTPRRYRADGLQLLPGRALDIVSDRVAQLGRATKASETVKRIRRDLFDNCLEGAANGPGLFTLSAPTGAGKTLAMLAFALEHARRHELRRVVVVIPYLSIIEQTARIYRELFAPTFGELYLLEDHSLADSRHERSRGGNVEDDVDEATRMVRLLTENWDAPVVVTTSVQCLESLFANRPRPCRKLHRLARSVMLFDEVQTLPPQLAVPTLAALSRLAERYGSTVVFSTATQPAFDHLHDDVKTYCAGAWQPREIVHSRLRLFERAQGNVRGGRRARVEWRIGERDRVTWEALANELAAPENRQVLCVVNLKRHARILAERLDGTVDGLLHLSTNMCPLHRTRVLNEVRQRLTTKQACVLISTQCVEAGVDVDFPRVYRALGPLDAIAQAAGRCNREGLLDGIVRVFVPEDEDYPPGWYKQAADATRVFLSRLTANGNRLDESEIIQDPERLRAYYRTLYDLSDIGAMSDKQGRELRKAFDARHFVDAANHYRLIPRNTINVLVPYDAAEFKRLCQLVDREGRLTRAWVWQAREHAVGLFRPGPNDRSDVWNCLRPLPVARNREPEHMTSDWFVLVGPDLHALYDRDLLGLKELHGQWIA